MRKNETAISSDLTLDIDPKTVRALGYRIVDIIADELAEPMRRPIFPPAQSRRTLEALFGGPLPRESMAPEDLLTMIQEHLLPAAFNANHPRLMAYVLSSPVPLAGLIEALVSTLKLFQWFWKIQPASSQIEVTVARWLGEMVGFARDAAGHITTGGSWANLVGLAIARVRCGGWNVRTEGLADHQTLVAYVSEEGHSCLDKSMELLGIGRYQLRKIPVGPDYRIRPEILEDTIKADRTAGFKPFCLIGNAGTVNTGVIDPLDILAEIATRYQLWFHVDGAYGAFATLASETRPLFAGIERADSLVLDPHKWLNVPYEAGCILVRNWADLADTFSLVPAYLSATAGDEEHNHGQYGFELSRTDRALKVWLALRQYGVDRYTRLVENHLALARYLADRVREAEDFEIVSEPVLSICCFRYVPPDIGKRTEQIEAYLNDLNRAIEMALISDGRALVSGTELHGTRVLRVCIVNHRVTREGVEQTLLLLRKFGYELDTQMRS